MHPRRIRSWLHLHGLLRQPVKQLAARSGGSAVKPKRELIEIIIQMFRPHRTWMRAQEPAREQRDDPVRARPAVFAILIAALNGADVRVARQFTTGVEAVGDDGATRRDVLPDEPMQLRPAHIGQTTPPNPAKAPGYLLRRDGHNRFGAVAPSVSSPPQ